MPDQLRSRPWARYHDDPRQPLRGTAPTVRVSSLDDVIRVCRRGGPAGARKLRASGSHWALSAAAIGDDVQVETHNRPTVKFPAMSRTLYDILPGCLSTRFMEHLANLEPQPFDPKSNTFNEGLYPFHFETGKRIFQAYAELNLGDGDNDRSLAYLLRKQYNNDTYSGPWAFPTLGGAGGQTVFGAMTTGTHGGDFAQPPIADAILAMHLVCDGGKHYWVERQGAVMDVQMTDDALLRQHFGGTADGDPSDFAIIRDDDFFNALLVSAGRFGIVYSIVVGAVRQYMLCQERKLDLPATWREVAAQVRDPHSELFTRPLPMAMPAGSGPVLPQRFTQVAVLMSPIADGEEHQVAVTRRWNYPLVAAPDGRPPGETARVGTPGAVDPRTNAVAFSAAGNAAAYSPEEDNPWKGAAPGFLDRACSDSDFVKGAVESVVVEIQKFIDSGGMAKVGGTIAAVVTVATILDPVLVLTALTLLIAALIAILAALFNWIHKLVDGAGRLGEVLDNLREVLLEPDDPALLQGGILVWRCIALELFKFQQSESTYAAVSYAVMDGHNYTDKSCLVHGDSLEAFFDADSDGFSTFLGGVLTYEQLQQREGRAFVGYSSLRFTGKSAALLGPEVWDRTCVFEIAGLADVKGSKELIAYAELRARKPDLDCRLHWGQKTEVSEQDVERWYGDTVESPGGRLGAWRAALARVTENGRLDRFSSAFTRRAGLEVVQPLIDHVNLSPAHVALHQPATLSWNGAANPPGTTLTVTSQGPLQRQPVSFVATTTVLTGSATFVPVNPGRHVLDVTVSFTTPGGSVRTGQAVLALEVDTP